MSVKIVGLSGMSGSGKDTAAIYIQDKYGFNHFSIGSFIRSICKEKNLEPTRENLIKISIDYLESYGEDFFSRLIIKEIEKNNYKKVVVNSIRKFYDYNFLSSLSSYNFKLIYIDTPDLTRFERIRQRGTENGVADYFKYQRASEIEAETFDYLQLQEIANLIIENCTTLEDFKTSIDQGMHKLNLN